MPSISPLDERSTSLPATTVAAAGVGKQDREADTPLKVPDPAEGLGTVPDVEYIESSRFPALRYRNFRLFWIGNLISLIGTIAEGTAQGWLLRTLTPDPLRIAQVTAFGSAPILFFTLAAGVVADRVDKRRALIVTNSIAVVLSLILAAIVFLGVVQVWHIAVLAFCVGTVTAFDIPIRQSFNREMVGQRDLPNAIALNSSAFNSARVLGPMVGGVLLNLVSIAGCFLVNSLSFFALIFNLSRMDSKHVKVEREPVRLNDIWEGLLWVRRHPILWLVIILVAFVSLCAMSFSSLLAIFAKDVWHSDERGFSLLMTCNGFGAMGAAIGMAVFGRMRHKGKRLLLGAALFCTTVVAFAYSPNIPIACFFLILAGWFLLTFLMTANTLVQTLSPDDLRGRVFSLYSLALVGTSPLGALFLGSLARSFGAPQAVRIGAGIALCFVLGIWLRFRGLWKEK